MLRNVDFETMFNPKAVAIVGASEKSTGRFHGASFISNFQKLGFEGRLYPVNPKGGEVLGLKVYPNLISLPETPDLVIVTTPASEVPQVLGDCIARGVKNVHVFTAGFSESGEEEGKQLEEKIKGIALRSGLNLVGPNCMGVSVPRIGMLTLHGVSIRSGSVAFLSQSGGHALQFAHYAQGFGIGFSKFISYGNGCVIDSTDFLDYLATDPETSLITLYIEGVRDGQKLFKQVKEINRIKPVIIWKGGMTEVGARAASSHTGSLAGNIAVWNAFFKQTGVVQVNSLDELADVVMTFLYLSPPRGRRAALFLGGGGHSVVTADFFAREGLEVPILGFETRLKLKEIMPAVGTSLKNPIDCEPMMREPILLEPALKIVAQDPSIDILIANLHLDMLWEEGSGRIGEISELMCHLKASLQQKILVTVLETWGGNPSISLERSRLQKEFLEAGIGVYRTIPRACRALAKFIQYHEFQKVAVC